MTDPVTEFARLFAPLLAANLLTVAFVWAFVQYSRREQAGVEKQPGSGVYLFWIIAAPLIGLLAFYIALH